MAKVRRLASLALFLGIFGLLLVRAPRGAGCAGGSATSSNGSPVEGQQGPAAPAVPATPDVAPPSEGTDETSTFLPASKSGPILPARKPEGSTPQQAPDEE